jgi:hypothetical protein
MQALILPTSGKLGPLSSYLPSSLLPLFGRPILGHLLELLAGMDITVAAQEHPEALEERYPDLKILLTRPGQSRLDIWQRLHPKETCLILKEGTLIGLDLVQLRSIHQGPLTVIRAQGGQEVGILAEADVQDPWDRSIPYQVFDAQGYGDANTPAGYIALHREALLGRIPLTIPGSEVSPGVWIEKGAEIHPQAKLEAPCWISHLPVSVGNASCVTPIWKGRS